MPPLQSGREMDVNTRITYPLPLDSPLDTLEPEAAFIAPPHTEVEMELTSGEWTWNSGRITTSDYTCPLPVLRPSRQYTLRVRVGGKEGPGEWSDPVQFETCDAPVLRLEKPRMADRVIGPQVEVAFHLENPEGPVQVRLDVDGAPADVRERDTGRHQVDLQCAPGLHTLRLSAGSRTVDATFYVWNSPLLKESIHLLDLSSVAGWNVREEAEQAERMYDLLHAASVLQGIVNRDHPRLLLNVFETDSYWLRTYQQQGRWLQDCSIEAARDAGAPEEALLETIRMFRDDLEGLVVWDEAVPATSNVATTAAGVENLLPVRGGAMASAFGRALQEMGLPVKLDLRGMFTGQGSIPDTDRASTGSAKCDAYVWAMERYLKTGRCNPRRIGYWLDAFWLQNPSRQPWWENCLVNHDWMAANRGFLVDLSNWGDEAPQDDPHQPIGTDLQTLQEVMHAAWEQAGGRMIHVAGFTPWAFKYTDHAIPPGSHSPVDSEWETVRVLSAYNGYLDADAHGISAAANSSFWRHLPRPERYVQSPLPTPASLRRKGYLDDKGELAPRGYTHLYIGDFDSAAWLSRRLPKLWADPERGKLPMAWAFNPNLDERMPQALHLARETATAADFFMAGDSGAGYVNPTVLLEPRPISGLASAEEQWVQHCREFFQQHNYRITGFLINGRAGMLTPESEKMTAQFSPDGTASQRAWLEGGHMTDNMPVALMLHDLCPDVEASVKCMEGYRESGLQFLDFRLILLGPSFVRELLETANARADADRRFELLDPYAFFSLLRHRFGGSNNHRATFTFDDLPDTVQAGDVLPVTAGVRNEGWNSWQQGDITLEAGVRDSSGFRALASASLGVSVEPGEGAVVRMEIPFPVQAGPVEFYLDLVDQGEPIRRRGNPLWQSRIQLV